MSRTKGIHTFDDGVTSGWPYANGSYGVRGRGQVITIYFCGGHQIGNLGRPDPNRPCAHGTHKRALFCMIERREAEHERTHGPSEHYESYTQACNAARKHARMAGTPRYVFRSELTPNDGDWWISRDPRRGATRID